MNAPTVQPAAVYKLDDFQPAGPIVAGKPVARLVRDPAAGRHAADEVQARRRPAHRRPPDLRPGRPRLHHPQASADRRRRTIAETITFPAPGRYRLVVDVYPASADQQSTRTSSSSGSVDVKGAYTPKPLPPTSTTAGAGRLPLHAARRRRPEGDPGAARDGRRHRARRREARTFTPWFGALAHAIFFRKGSLDYFHTHVCAPGVSGCTSVLGGDEGHRHLGHAREAQRRGARPGAGHVAAVPADPDRREGAHRPRSRSTSTNKGGSLNPLRRTLVARRRHGRRPRRRLVGLCARARQPGRVALGRAAAVQPRRADREGGRDDDEDRAHAARRASRSTRSRRARAGSARCSRPARARTP